MRKITGFIKILLFVGILFSVANCSTSEVEDNQNAQSSAEAKVWYDSHQSDYDATILKYIQKLEWENAIIVDGLKGKVIEVPFTLEGNLKTSNENATLMNDHHRLVFVEDGEREFKTFYIQIFSDDANANSLEKISAYNGVSNNFNGKIFTQDLATNKTTAIEYNSGKNIQTSSTSKWREENIDCTFLGWWNGDGSFTPIKLISCDSGGDESPIGGGPTTGGGGGSGGSTGTSTIKSEAQFIVANENADPNAFDISFFQNGNTITSTAKIALIPLANILLEIPQSKVGNTYVVDNVVTNLVGVTIGLSWSQTSYSQTVSGTTTTVNINGIASFVMPIEGLGTIYSYQHSYSIKIDNTNGKIISGRRTK